MGRAHEVRAASMAKTAAIKSKLYSRYGKEIYIAAKAGVPDPNMNLALARKIKEAKSNQVPADVIKRAIDKAKGGTGETYDECRYEGFGPANCTVIVDCLTDNTNRTFTAVKGAFAHTKGAKMAAAGACSYDYRRLGVFEFYNENVTEDDLMEQLLESDAAIEDIKVDDGDIQILVDPSDFNAVQDTLEKLYPGTEYDRCEVAMVPSEYITLDNPDDIEYYNKLIGLLMECEDVNKIYTNAIVKNEE